MNKNKKNVINIYKNVKDTVKSNPTGIVDKILSKRKQAENEIKKIKDKKIQRICKNSFTLLEYAQEKDKQMVSEGLGSFIKNHIGKIIICVLLLVLCLPIIATSILGVSSSSILTGIFSAIGGVFTCIGTAFIKLVSLIPGVGETTEKLSMYDISFSPEVNQAPGIQSTNTDSDWPGVNPKPSDWPGVNPKPSDWPGVNPKPSDWPGTKITKSAWPGT